MKLPVIGTGSVAEHLPHMQARQFHRLLSFLPNQAQCLFPPSVLPSLVRDLRPSTTALQLSKTEQVWDEESETPFLSLLASQPQTQHWHPRPTGPTTPFMPRLSEMPDTEARTPPLPAKPFSRQSLSTAFLPYTLFKL